MSTALLTEFSFRLPRGLVDANGIVHQDGIMRLATARDELAAHRHRLVQTHPEYLMLTLLAQVITRLGTLDSLQPEELEHLFTQDLAYLREFYNRVNQTGTAKLSMECPHCQHQFQTELALSGES